MKIVVLTEKLLAALNSMVVDKNPVLPVLAMVHLKAENNFLELTGTDVETTVNVRIGARIEQPGETLVRADVLTSLVKGIKDDMVTLELADNRLKIVTKGIDAELDTMDPNEFPSIGDINFEPMAIIASAALLKGLKAVVHAAAREDHRPVLNGVLFHFKDDTLRLIAADGFRLAIMEIGAQLNQNAGEREVIVPLTAVNALIRVASLPMLNDIVRIGVKVHNNVEKLFLSFNGTIFFTTPLEGKFPAYEAVLNTHLSTKATAIEVMPDELINAIERAMTVVDESNRITIHVNGKEARIHVPKTANSRGKVDTAFTTLSISQETEAHIHVNGNYLLKAIPDRRNSITLEIYSPQHPIVVKQYGYIEVIMPMSLTS